MSGYYLRGCIADKKGQLWFEDLLRREDYKYFIFSNTIVDGYVKILNDLPEISQILEYIDNYAILKTAEGRILILHSEQTNGIYLDICFEPIKSALVCENKIYALSVAGGVYKVTHDFIKNSFVHFDIELIASDIKEISMHCDSLILVNKSGQILFETTSVYKQIVDYENFNLGAFNIVPPRDARLRKTYDVTCFNRSVFATKTDLYQIWCDGGLYILEGICLPKPIIDIHETYIGHINENPNYGVLIEAVVIDCEGGLWVSYRKSINEPESFCLIRIDTGTQFTRFICVPDGDDVYESVLVESRDGIVYEIEICFDDDCEIIAKVSDVIKIVL